MILRAELNKSLKTGGTAGSISSSKYTTGHTLEVPQSYWIYPAPLSQTPKKAQISNDFQSHQTIQDIWAFTVLSFIFYNPSPWPCPFFCWLPESAICFQNGERNLKSEINHGMLEFGSCTCTVSLTRFFALPTGLSTLVTCFTWLKA